MTCDPAMRRRAMNAVSVGICGDIAATVLSNLAGTVCRLPAGHAGWHTDRPGGGGMDWSRADDPERARRMRVIHQAALTLPCQCRHDHDGPVGVPCARCQILTETEGTP